MSLLLLFNGGNTDLQTLEPTLFANTSTFGTPTVRLNLHPTIHTDGDSFGAPQIDLNLAPALYADGDTFGAATVNLNLHQTTFSGTSTFGAPNVHLNLHPSDFSGTATFGSPAITLNLHPTLILDADTFGAAQLDHRLYATAFSNTQSFPAGAKAKLNLHPTHFADDDTIHTDMGIFRRGSSSSKLKAEAARRHGERLRAIEEEQQREIERLHAERKFVEQLEALHRKYLKEGIDLSKAGVDVLPIVDRSHDNDILAVLLMEA